VLGDDAALLQHAHLQVEHRVVQGRGHPLGRGHRVRRQRAMH
jgi:hypothetical protein